MKWCTWMVIGMAAAAMANAQTARLIVSSEDGRHQLTEQAAVTFTERMPSADVVITVDPGETYQTIIGLGSSLEHATAYNISLLPEDEQREVIRKIVDPDEGIGMNLMRICIGTSDFTGDPWYTYNDLPEGETDNDLSEFSIEKDRDYLLPIIKMAREANPDLKFFASPWSPPAWMKAHHTLTGSRMDPGHFDVFARYLLKFIHAYEAEGIPIHAITVQNEPNFPNPEYPTCLWRPEMQRDFIRDHLGPLFASEGVDTLIWCWDHNWNFLDFPRAILSDPEAAQYVDGTGFHLYEGEVEAQSVLKKEFPDKHIYFTEGSTFGTRGAIHIINILRNWARSYNAWVTVLDQDRKPNNGPHSASPTAIILHKDDNMRLEYRYDYYMYGQFMKYIDRGATRISSEGGNRRFAHIAFENPDGEMVLVAANLMRGDATFDVTLGGKTAEVTIPARATATLLWE